MGNERIPYTDEQLDASDRMSIALGKVVKALETERWLARNLGLVHRVTCQYRLECVSPARSEFIRRQEEWIACGGGKVAFHNSHERTERKHNGG